MRFGRSAVPVINDRSGYHFEMGKGIVLREGTDVTIVATGILVSSALEAAEKLAAEGISAEVINIHTIKPLDKELIINSAKKTGKVVTAEEHRRPWFCRLRGIVRRVPDKGMQNRHSGCIRRVRFCGRASCKIWS